MTVAEPTTVFPTGELPEPGFVGAGVDEPPIVSQSADA